MSAQKTFVLGGARSGKTNRALTLCQGFEKRIYIATATPGDDEMIERIKRHQAERDPHWSTLEAPIKLARTLSGLEQNPPPGFNPKNHVVLIDCLTLWLSNLMLSHADIARQSDSLIAAINAFPGNLVLVSNEVGLGIVPDTKLGRDFRDAQGLLNQRVAASVDIVEFIAAGLPMRLKP